MLLALSPKFVRSTLGDRVPDSNAKCSATEPMPQRVHRTIEDERSVERPMLDTDELNDVGRLTRCPAQVSRLPATCESDRKTRFPLFDNFVPVGSEALVCHADMRVDDATRIERVVGDERVVLAGDFDDTRDWGGQEAAARSHLRA